MPRLVIHMFPRDLDTKRRLVKEITDVVAEVCKVSPDSVAISIEDMLDEYTAKAGVLRCDLPK
ncbi:MAG: tautomerase family protein [Defluviitaleaceae bacterium]|nr:tautomerase family protein [Defluviitaleaceae bacterium]